MNVRLLPPPLAMRALAAAALLLTALGGRVAAANHPELKWLTVETPHFVVHFHEGADETAQAAAGIAEAIYPAVTGLYDFEPPRRTHLILADYEDYANGSAYFFDGKFEIWATNLEFDLRGTTQWLWNVITHEFVHMINIQASQRTPRNIPAVYLQWFDYEKERRTDVLTGYPNWLVSYPLSGVIVPAWFAEGTAQYMAPDTHHDYWDAHRDMILRMAVLDDRMLSYDEMSIFKGSLASEMVYDHGFGLVRYIAREHGPESLEQIIHGLRNPTRLSAEGAFRKATGSSGHELYDRWRAELLADAQGKQAALGAERREGRAIGAPGTYNTNPSWSPDGKRLAWLSNLGGDFHRTTLVVRSVDPADSAGAEIEAIAAGATGSFTWSPDGDVIYFTRREDKDRFGAVYFDLFAYDLGRKRETRLTRGARVRDPAISPDGRKLAAVVNHDGTNDLVLIDLPANEEAALVTRITASPFGRQYYAPRWHPDGRSLLVDMFESGGARRPGETRDLVSLPAEAGAEPTPVFATPSDERMPVFAPDGSVVFSCDAPASGFRKYDLYRLDLATGKAVQVSNVLGGAFYPAASPDGRTIAYSGYTSQGYKIFLLPAADSLDRTVSEFPALAREESSAGVPPAMDWEPQPYRGSFSRFLVSPRLVVDEGRVRVGVYANTGDVINKQSIFGGASVGQRTDADLFVIYENRFWWPTLFLEAFWQRKHRGEVVLSKYVGVERRWDLDLRYDAVEIDLGAKLESGDLYSPFYYRELGARFRHSRNHLNIRVANLTPVTGLVDDGGILILPPGDGWDYYRGYDAIASYYRRSFARALDAEINPAGREISLTYMYSQNDLSPSGEQKVNEQGVATTVFEKNNFHQVEGSVHEMRRLPGWRHTLGLRLSGGWIDRPVDDFFWFRVGSRPGLRGYTYYSLEGRAYAMVRGTYRFPIWREIDHRFLQLLFERLYGGVFYEAGVVWPDPVWSHITRRQIADDLVRDVGFELRLDLVNFYTFPSRIHFEGAYPLDEVTIPTGITGADGDEPKTPKEWKFYFGVLFGY